LKKTQGILWKNGRRQWRNKEREMDMQKYGERNERVGEEEGDT